MGLDSILTDIQLLIRETAESLEKFTDPAEQPSEVDCDQLQKKLSDLQEKLSVYKYLKDARERSGEFTMHAKISETVRKEAPVSKIKEEPAPPVKPRAVARSFAVP